MICVFNSCFQFTANEPVMEKGDGHDGDDNKDDNDDNMNVDAMNTGAPFSIQ